MKVSIKQNEVDVFKPVSFTITLESEKELMSFLESINYFEADLTKKFSDKVGVDAKLAYDIHHEIWNNYYSLIK